jgi:hypothetical protein
MIRRHAISIALLALFAGGAAAHADADFILIDRNLRTQPLRVVEINDLAIVCREPAAGLRTIMLTDCIALAPPTPPVAGRRSSNGVLLLNDGQRLPGVPAPGSAQGDELAWTHPWLGRLEVPLDSIWAVTFRADVAVPVPGDSDVIVLVNEDRLEGFVTGLGDPITMEIEIDGTASDVRVPRDRAAAAALVAPRRAASGRRIWFDDGTMLDARTLHVGEDGYVRLDTTDLANTEGPIQIRMADVSGSPASTCRRRRCSTTAHRSTSVGSSTAARCSSGTPCRRGAAASPPRRPCPNRRVSGATSS